MLWSLGPSKNCSNSFAQFGTNHFYHCQMYCKCDQDYGSLECVLTHFWFILWTSARRIWPTKTHINWHFISLVNMKKCNTPCNYGRLECVATNQLGPSVDVYVDINFKTGFANVLFSAIVITGALNASPQINLVRLPGPASTGLFQQVGGISLITKRIMHPFRFRSTKNILLLTIFNCQRNIFEEALLLSKTRI